MEDLKEEIANIKNKVSIYLSVGRYQASENLLKLSLKEFGGLPELHNLLGQTYHRQSKFPQSLTQFELAFKQRPEFIESKLNFVVTLCDLGQYDKAISFFTKLSESLSPKDGQSSLTLERLAYQHARIGRLYEETGMNSSALAEYKKALSLFPSMPETRINLGKLYLAMGEKDIAKKEFEQVKSSSPDCETSDIWLGILNFNQGKKTTAYENWNNSFDSNSKNKIARAYKSLVNYFNKTT